MATTNTYGTPDNAVGTLNGFFKDTYAKKLKELIPDGVKLMKRIDFMPAAQKLGNIYHQPIILGLEHGVTFAGPEDDAFNLNAPVAGQVKDAQVRGNPVVLRSLLGYVAVSRALGGGEKAFMDATKFLIANMLRSMSKKLEIEMLYGQMGYGTVSSAASAPTYTITTAEFAPGIWAGAEGMPIEIRDSSGNLRGSAVISSVSLENRTFTTNAVIPGVSATDVIWHKGAYGNEFPGIHKILTTSSGTLFNINVANYSLFQGNSYSASSAALSFTKLGAATTRAVEKGLDGKVLALVNPRGWQNLLSDQAALRMYDDSYQTSKMENGATSIKFYSQNGEIEIEPSIYVKEGYSYILSLEDWSRVGSTDLTFDIPGQEGQYFSKVENSAAVETRLYADWAIFCSAPGRNTIITGIVNA